MEEGAKRANELNRHQDITYSLGKIIRLLEAILEKLNEKPTEAP